MYGWVKREKITNVKNMANEDRARKDNGFLYFMREPDNEDIQNNYSMNISKSMISGRTSSRAEFLRKATPLALISALGIPMSSCGVTDSRNDSDVDVNDKSDDSGDGDSNNDGNSNASAFSVDGNTITIDTSINGGEALASAGGWLIASEYGFLAINIDGTRVRAFSDVCTHASCRNAWQYSNETFTCTCHNSVFNSSGQVVSGPANNPLPEYTTSKNGDIIKITKG